MGRRSRRRVAKRLFRFVKLSSYNRGCFTLQRGPPKMATMTAAEIASPALVFETMTAFQRSSALCTAIELDVFRAIGEGLNDSKSIAQRCGTSERGMRILLDYLTIMQFLKKENGRYSHTATSAAFLDPK